MKNYEYIAKLFNDYETTHFFFQEVIMRYTTKEAERKYGLRGIMTHSEVTAGYMADGYARASGKVGICGSQSIGAANLAAGLGDAWLAGSPVVAITGKKTDTYQYRNCYQETIHSKIFEGTTKCHIDATASAEIPRLIRMAFQEASTGKPRPVHVDVNGLAGVESDVFENEDSYFVNSKYGHFPCHRSFVSNQELENAATLIASAQKPIIVIGRGAFISNAGKEILALMEKTQIPAVTSPDGKTVIDEKHSLWAGIVGSYGMGCANRLVSEADLVIFIGTQTADQTTCDWSAPKSSTKTIQIDIDASELGKNYPNCIGLWGDAKAVCNQLLSVVKKATHDTWISYVTESIQKQLEMQNSKAFDKEPIITQKLLNVISDILPDNAILVADTGYSAVWTANYVRMKPGQKYLRAAGSLGWSYPASIGVACACPDRPVFCYTGDGGFYYYMSEMETAMRYGIKTITIINNNGVFSQCVPAISNVYADNVPEGVNRVTFYKTPFTEIAKAWGLFAIHVENSEDIENAIKQAMAQDKPALIEVITEKNNYPISSFE